MADPLGSPPASAPPTITSATRPPLLENQTEPTSPPHSSPRLTVDDHDDVSAGSKPAFPSHVSEPVVGQLASPLRHHRRTPSRHREVKETLDARVEFLSDETDGRTHHRINQYVIQEEIGRGSYGSVHLAKDHNGVDYAIKEFSKVRLRKRAQSNILKHGPHRPPNRLGLPGPFGGRAVGSTRAAEKNDALYLIREEIAIMKKLNHPNLVQLIEVLDDPEEDSLYMVLEMCKNGVVMKVGLDDLADPYPEEACRHWFRDLILGVEYLHAQGVIHRDIKPDNLLLSDDKVLKVVDFGVSEMFEKPADMRTAKSAGSPAFLPPELCGKHADVEGRPVDIWSMGVCLYCLKYGCIPFNRDSMIDMYEAIRNDEPSVPEDENPALVDLFKRILEKDPSKRITMAELRNHEWVTKGGADPLLSAEENCAHPVEPPNELEVNHAFTRKMNHLIGVVKAFQRFKGLKAKKRADIVRAGGEVSPSDKPMDNPEFDAAEEKARAEEIQTIVERRRRFLGTGSYDDLGDKGHARDVSDHEPLFLGIGTGGRDDFAEGETANNIVADSPTAVDFNIYDRAYEDAVEERLRANPTRRPTLYLTRFVKEKDHLKHLENLIEASGLPGLPATASSRLADLASSLKLGSAAAPQVQGPVDVDSVLDGKTNIAGSIAPQL